MCLSKADVILGQATPAPSSTLLQGWHPSEAQTHSRTHAWNIERHTACTHAHASQCRKLCLSSRQEARKWGMQTVGLCGLRPAHARGNAPVTSLRAKHQPGQGGASSANGSQHGAGGGCSCWEIHTRRRVKQADTRWSARPCTHHSLEADGCCDCWEAASAGRLRRPLPMGKTAALAPQQHPAPFLPRPTSTHWLHSAICSNSRLPDHQPLSLARPQAHCARFFCTTGMLRLSDLAQQQAHQASLLYQQAAPHTPLRHWAPAGMLRPPHRRCAPAGAPQWPLRCCAHASAPQHRRCTAAGAPQQARCSGRSDAAHTQAHRSRGDQRLRTRSSRSACPPVSSLAHRRVQPCAPPGAPRRPLPRLEHHSRCAPQRVCCAGRLDLAHQQVHCAVSCHALSTTAGAHHSRWAALAA